MRRVHASAATGRSRTSFRTDHLELRLARPDSNFVISKRTSWDPTADNHDQILRDFDAFRQTGVTHFVPEPRQKTLADYLQSIESLSDLMNRGGASLDLFAP